LQLHARAFALLAIASAWGHAADRTHTDHHGITEYWRSFSHREVALDMIKLY